MTGKVIKAKNSMIEKALHYGAELTTEVGDNNLLANGAKASHKGGGWWYVHGYAQNGRDFKEAMGLINN